MNTLHRKFRRQEDEFNQKRLSRRASIFLHASGVTIRDMRQTWFALRAGSWPVFMPFTVALALLALLALYPFTGIGPANNSFALGTLVAVVLGWVVGVVALFRARHIALGWRWSIGLLYLPAVLFSLLLAGF